MKTHTFDGYKMTLKNTKNRDRNGKFIVEYTFSKPDGTLIFSGNDFHCSLRYQPESKESAIALLGFLTLKPGDTDEEYFENYTPEQMAFAVSFDCEQLQSYTLDD